MRPSHEDSATWSHRLEAALWQLATALFDPVPLASATAAREAAGNAMAVDDGTQSAGRSARAATAASAVPTKRRRLDAVTRAHALTLWLKATSRDALDREKRLLDTPAKRMFSLLTAHHLPEACALAIAYKDVRLATLVRPQYLACFYLVRPG